MGKPPVTGKPRGIAAKARVMAKRQLIVNPGFQYRTLRPIVIFGGILALLLVIFVFIPFQHDANNDPSPAIRGLLSARLPFLHAYFWISFALAGALAALYTLVWSNRLAGPLYKLRVVLIQHAEGNTMRLRFREGDEFREFEEVVNRLAKRLDSLSTGSVQQFAIIQKRIKFLKARLQSQDLSTADICRELDATLKDAGLD
ncbi:MAG TPA: hypothetical protein VKV95_17365 [Terriglobia bacterium]|nr:hypothetical protein [Terriglobia bacterium]